ncbi:MAG: hypothetical protein WAN35_01225 [Terracidiphilus sp.]
MKAILKAAIPVFFLAVGVSLHAAQLSADASNAIPHSVQQLVAIDYHAMENSTSAMDLRARVMPPELKRFEDALKSSGLNENHDVEQLAFALFREKEGDDKLDTVGIAQGQFPLQDILASFRKLKLKATLVRANKVYPLAKTGMVVCFVNPSTMVFGDSDAVNKALDARDSVSPSILTNAPMMDAMKSVESEPLWSILDKKGTETMMKQILGEAGSGGDFDSVKKHLDASWYGMDFQHGVKFDLTIATGDSFASATLSSLLSAGLTLRKASGTEAEKQALSATTLSSEGGKLSIHFATGDAQFNSLLQSPLFRGIVR